MGLEQFSPPTNWRQGTCLDRSQNKFPPEGGGEDYPGRVAKPTASLGREWLTEGSPFSLLEPFSPGGGLGRAWLGLVLRAAGVPVRTAWCQVRVRVRVSSSATEGERVGPRHWHRAPEVSASFSPSPQLQVWGLVFVGVWGWGDQQEEARGLLYGERGWWR